MVWLRIHKPFCGENQEVFMNIIPPNGYNAALYMRLSKDEIAKEESNSITNQRNILTEFANKNGFRIVGEYIDDGYSGTTLVRVR